MNEDIRPVEPPALLQELAAGCGGQITECAVLPDGSGFATMSMPLPKTHWLYADDGTYEAPPMPLRPVWLNDQSGWSRHTLNEAARAAAKYAIRSATMKGKELDFDPDAMVQNFVTGLLGYHTPNGLSSDDWANPPHLRGESAKSEDAVDPVGGRVTD